MKRLLVFLWAVTMVFGVAGIASALTLTEWGGHQYAVVPFTGTWSEAETDVATNADLGPNWHLATITSQDEQDFITGLLNANGLDGLLWVGGWQDPQDIEEDLEDINLAKANWHWVTGEEWAYTNWADDNYPEPNNYDGADETYLQLDGRYTDGVFDRNWEWNDALNGDAVIGYVAEDPVPTPEPATMLLFGSGLLGLAGLGRKKFFKKL